MPDAPQQSAAFDVPLTGARIELTRGWKHQIKHQSDGMKVGYIRLKQFNANALRTLRAALLDLERSRGMQGYALDLRSKSRWLLAASVRDFVASGR